MSVEKTPTDGEPIIDSGSCTHCDWSGLFVDAEIEYEYDAFKGQDVPYPVCPNCDEGGLEDFYPSKIPSKMEIDISNLEIGQRVHYLPLEDCDESLIENGMIKEIPEHTNTAVRVVFNCAGEWDDFMNYTSQLTDISQLKLGWFHATAKDSEDKLKITSVPGGKETGKIIVTDGVNTKEIPAVVFTKEQSENLLECVDEAYKDNIPPPPTPPNSRMQREGITVFCQCGSTMTRTGFLSLFGERRCDQPKCKINKRKQL